MIRGVWAILIGEAILIICMSNLTNHGDKSGKEKNYCFNISLVERLNETN